MSVAGGRDGVETILGGGYACHSFTVLFRLTYDLNSFKSRVNRHLLSLGSF